MTSQRAAVRLFVAADLAQGLPVRPDAAQCHYLTRVMRLAEGAAVGLFNGRDGEWRARLTAADRRSCDLLPEEQTAPQAANDGPRLVFAPLKKGPMDVLVEKTVELGVSRLSPVATRNTAAARINTDRLRAQAVEAAEQCGRVTVPEIDSLIPLDRLLSGWEPTAPLYVLDETGAGVPIADAPPPGPEEGAAAPAFVCGPEGGFAAVELDALGKLPFVTRIGLGPRILRAETAAIAALACWQFLLGDGRRGPAAKGPRR